MPIYEYDCGQCGARCELLVRGDEPRRCPACGSTTLARQFSAFAAHTGGSGTGQQQQQSEPAGCGRCGDPRGPGACSMN